MEDIGYQVLSAVTMRNTVFWDVTPHSLVGVELL
jgi:hypothetical protein